MVRFSAKSDYFKMVFEVTIAALLSHRYRFVIVTPPLPLSFPLSLVHQEALQTAVSH